VKQYGKNGKKDATVKKERERHVSSRRISPPHNQSAAQNERRRKRKESAYTETRKLSA